MLLFLDGQAHYATAGIGTKYSTVSTTDTTWAVAPEGRFGNCLTRVATSVFADGYLEVAPLTNRLGPWEPQAGGVCGFAIKVDDLTRVNPDQGIGPVPDDGIFVVVEGGVPHVCVHLNPSGTFTLRAHALSESVLAISSEGLTSGTWMFVEFQWVIAASGTFVIRVNGVPVLTFAGDTRNQDPSHVTLNRWNVVRLLRVESLPAPFLTLRMCDLYLADDTAADADDVATFLGDGIIETILPNGAGASTGWTPNTGTNWEAVDDTPAPDGDATYVAASPVGTTDTYQFEDLPPESEIKGVQVCLLPRKVTEGSSSLAPIVRQGTTDYLGPTQGVASVAYDRYLTQAWDLNPATMDKFTVAEINGGQFGVQKMT